MKYSDMAGSIQNWICTICAEYVPEYDDPAERDEVLERAASELVKIVERRGHSFDRNGYIRFRYNDPEMDKYYMEDEETIIEEELIYYV